MCHLKYVAVAVCLVASLGSVTEADAQTKKVRVINSTDDADIVVKCVGLNASGFSMFVKKDQIKIQSNVALGDRGITMWETFNEEAIIASKFTLKDKNASFKVVGDSSSGYSLQISYDDF